MKKDNLSGFSFLFSYLLARLQKAAASSAAQKLHHDPNRLFWCEETVGPSNTQGKLWDGGIWGYDQPGRSRPERLFVNDRSRVTLQVMGNLWYYFRRMPNMYFVGKYHRVRLFQKVFWRILQFLPIDQPSCSCCCWHPEICGFRAISVSDHPYLHQVLAAILAPWISAAR